MIQQVFVVYDDRCGFCCSCARWLEAQPKAVHVECVARGNPRMAELFPDLPTPPKADLTVVDDHGGVYYGDNAWLMAMWSLQDWRVWSFLLAWPTLRPVARFAFELISAGRHGLYPLL